MEFSVVIFPDGETCDQQLTELLFDVYVAGGFSDNNRALHAFQANEIVKRGEVFIAKVGSELLGTVILNRSENEFRQIAKDHERKYTCSP